MAGKAAEEGVNKGWFGECLHAHGLRLQTPSGCRPFLARFTSSQQQTDKKKQSR